MPHALHVWFDYPKIILWRVDLNNETENCVLFKITDVLFTPYFIHVIEEVGVITDYHIIYRKLKGTSDKTSTWNLADSSILSSVIVLTDMTSPWLATEQQMQRL